MSEAMTANVMNMWRLVLRLRQADIYLVLPPVLYVELNNEDMMTKNEWLERATKFDLGTCIYYNRPVVIECRDQLDGSRKWVLKMNEWVLGKDGEFIWEPMPSSRTDEFIANTRFDTPDDCHSFWVSAVTEQKSLYVS